jgi:cysteine desulfurase
MTISGHKIGGPLGVGALLARRGLDLTPVLHGGGQERGVRSGTLDTPAARSFAVAVDAAVRDRPEVAARLSVLRDDLVRRVRAAVPGAVLRGPDPTVPTQAVDGGPGSAGPGDAATPGSGPVPASPARLPANAHFTFPCCEGDSLLYLLDSAGVQCSTGSACQAGVPQPSHVLLAMGVEEHDARGALRFSLGHTSAAADVDALLAALPDAVARAQAAGLASASLAGRGSGR